MFKTRCKLSKMDFSKTASNGEFSNNLQWGLTLLWLKFASAVYTHKKQVKAAIIWSSIGCHLSIGANQGTRYYQRSCKQNGERPPVLLFPHCRVIGKNKDCLKICSNQWTKKLNLMELFSTFTLHIHLRLIWALQTARNRTLSKATISLGKSIKLLHCFSWLNSKRQRLPLEQRGTEIIADIVQSIRHLDLELKAH